MLKSPLPLSHERSQCFIFFLEQANILISNTGSACLADFGLSSMDDPEILRWTSLKTMTRVGGTVRWQAPELMDDLEDGTRPTFSADVYSVASVMYEVIYPCLIMSAVKKNCADCGAVTGVH